MANAMAIVIATDAMARFGKGNEREGSSGSKPKGLPFERGSVSRSMPGYDRPGRRRSTTAWTDVVEVQG